MILVVMTQKLDSSPLVSGGEESQECPRDHTVHPHDTQNRADPAQRQQHAG